MTQPKILADLAAIDRALADAADVGKVSRGDTFVQKHEIDEIRLTNGDPGGTIDCHGCGYGLGPHRTRCPKCNAGTERALSGAAALRQELAEREDNIRTIAESRAKRAKSKGADAKASAKKAARLGPTPLEIAKATGFKRGTREFARAYGREWRKQNPKTQAQVAASNARARAKRAASKGTP